MLIEVTQADITRGTPSCSWGCPIAYAIERALPECLGRPGMSVHVFYTSVSVSDWNEEIASHRLPKVAREFVKRFDRGHRVKPFAFELPL